VNPPVTSHEWSILQEVDLKYRGQITHAPEFLKVDEYDLLVVSSRDNSTRSWTMLWPRAPPFYKRIPEGNFQIPRAHLFQLQE
jgi:hypothetical protein